MLSGTLILHFGPNIFGKFVNAKVRCRGLAWTGIPAQARKLALSGTPAQAQSEKNI